MSNERPKQQKTVGELKDGNIETLNEVGYALGMIHRATFEQWLAYPRQLLLQYGLIPLIAGGAVRDTLFNKEVKDIDVFLTRSQWIADRLDPDFKLAWWHEIAMLEGWTTEHEHDGSSKDPEFQEFHNHNRNIVAVYSYQHPEVSIPYNFIVIDSDKDSREVLSDFDIGICQIGINPFGMAIMTKAFRKDMENRTFTATREQASDRQAMRLQRLRDKYPLWSQGSDKIILPGDPC